MYPTVYTVLPLRSGRVTNSATQTHFVHICIYIIFIRRTFYEKKRTGASRRAEERFTIGVVKRDTWFKKEERISHLVFRVIQIIFFKKKKERKNLNHDFSLNSYLVNANSVFLFLFFFQLTIFSLFPCETIYVCQTTRNSTWFCARDWFYCRLTACFRALETGKW